MSRQTPSFATMLAQLSRIESSLGLSSELKAETPSAAQERLWDEKKVDNCINRIPSVAAQHGFLDQYNAGLNQNIQAHFKAIHDALKVYLRLLESVQVQEEETVEERARLRTSHGSPDETAITDDMSCRAADNDDNNTIQHRETLVDDASGSDDTASLSAITSQYHFLHGNNTIPDIVISPPGTYDCDSALDARPSSPQTEELVKRVVEQKDRSRRMRKRYTRKQKQRQGKGEEEPEQTTPE